MADNLSAARASDAARIATLEALLREAGAALVKTQEWASQLLFTAKAPLFPEDVSAILTKLSAAGLLPKEK